MPGVKIFRSRGPNLPVQQYVCRLTRLGFKLGAAIFVLKLPPATDEYRTRAT